MENPTSRDLCDDPSSPSTEVGTAQESLILSYLLQVSVDISELDLDPKCPPSQDFSELDLDSKCLGSRFKMSYKSSEVVFGFDLQNLSRLSKSSDTAFACSPKSAPTLQNLNPYGQEEQPTCAESV
jgi:hypothetical protein